MQENSSGLSFGYLKYNSFVFADDVILFYSRTIVYASL